MSVLEMFSLNKQHSTCVVFVSLVNTVSWAKLLGFLGFFNIFLPLLSFLHQETRSHGYNVHVSLESRAIIHIFYVFWTFFKYSAFKCIFYNLKSMGQFSYTSTTSDFAIWSIFTFNVVQTFNKSTQFDLQKYLNRFSISFILFFRIDRV